MTFLEAAIEILRNADGPLHFAEVTKRAVDENLLSHVGRDPEAAMRSCLNSASRVGQDGQPPLIVRDKPGLYGLREGADLPPSSRPPAPAPTPPSRPTLRAPAASARSEAQPSRGGDRGRHGDGGRRGGDGARGQAGGRGRGRGERDAQPVVETARNVGDMEARSKVKSRSSRRAPSVVEDEETPEVEAEPVARRAERGGSVEFVAPEGSGLDGVTDVALVMANAMSRLVEERPDLRQEFDAVQQHAEPAARPLERDRERERERERERDRERQTSQANDERGGRRRRRRRRRGKRVEWQAGGDARPTAAGDRLLDDVAAVLDGAGARSLHVRQIAEQLAAKGLLGGEISEIERATTAALLLDIRTRGRASRFAARGDARYQIQGSRLPERAAKAEAALRQAVRDVEQETSSQFIQWLQSLGARALESLVRIWLQQEGHVLHASLPAGRGIGRLVVDDPEADDEEARLLVAIVPRRTAFDPKAWEGEPERHHCSAVLIFAMGEAVDELAGDARVIGVAELAGWLRERGIGVQKLTLEVSVLDPTVVESVAGLDS